MLALVLEKSPVLKYDYPKPVPDRGEVLVRVLKAGICNTDLELLQGYKTFQGVLGHEFVGIVESHPDSTWLGKRVVGEINLSCGRCVYCKSGLNNHCQSRNVLGIYKKDGAFAEYLTLPTENLHQVPPGISDDVAVFTEPLAAALQIVQQAHIRPDDKVIVIGDGKLGLICAQVLALNPCQLMLLGRHASKLKLAQDWGIATCKVGAEQERIPWEMGLADVVVDCSGTPNGLHLALQLTRPRGTVILKSTYYGQVNLDMSSIVVREITIIGSRCGPFAPALRLLSSNRVHVAELIHGTYPLSQAPLAMEKARDRESIKILLDTTA